MIVKIRGTGNCGILYFKFDGRFVQHRHKTLDYIVCLVIRTPYFDNNYGFF